MRYPENDLVHCLGCDNLAAVRGLCQACYTFQFRRVKAKKTTWAELEKVGRCLPAQKSGEKWQQTWKGQIREER